MIKDGLPSPIQVTISYRNAHGQCFVSCHQPIPLKYDFGWSHVWTHYFDPPPNVDGAWASGQFQHQAGITFLDHHANVTRHERDFAFLKPPCCHIFPLLYSWTKFSKPGQRNWLLRDRECCENVAAGQSPARYISFGCCQLLGRRQIRVQHTQATIRLPWMRRRQGPVSRLMPFSQR